MFSDGTSKNAVSKNCEPQAVFRQVAHPQGQSYQLSDHHYRDPAKTQ